MLALHSVLPAIGRFPSSPSLLAGTSWAPGAVPLLPSHCPHSSFPPSRRSAIEFEGGVHLDFIECLFFFQFASESRSAQFPGYHAFLTVGAITALLLPQCEGGSGRLWLGFFAHLNLEMIDLTISSVIYDLT